MLTTNTLRTLKLSGAPLPAGPPVTRRSSHPIVTPLTFSGVNSIHKFQEVPPSGASNEGGVGKISSFLSLSVNVSKTVADTAKVTWLIGSHIWAFHWHQDRWPSMTLNCCKVKFSWNFATLLVFWRQYKTAKRMKIDPYCQRRNCGGIAHYNVVFQRCTDCVDIASRSELGGVKQRWGGKTSLHTNTAVARLPAVS